MSVQRSGPVQLDQRGIEPPAHHQQLEAGLRRQSGDEGVGVDGEQQRVQLGDGLDEHHGVLAPTDRHQQPTGPDGHRGRAGRLDAGRTDGHRAGHGQPVGDGELAQPVVVEMPVEGGLRRAQAVVDHHLVRGGHLVVAGAGGDVEMQERPLEPGTRSSGPPGPPVRCRFGLEGDRLHELGAVLEGVVEGQGPALGVEGPAGDTECAEGLRLESARVVHRAASVVVTAPSPTSTARWRIDGRGPR